MCWIITEETQRWIITYLLLCEQGLKLCRSKTNLESTLLYSVSDSQAHFVIYALISPLSEHPFSICHDMSFILIHISCPSQSQCSVWVITGPASSSDVTVIDPARSNTILDQFSLPLTSPALCVCAVPPTGQFSH